MVIKLTNKTEKIPAVLLSFQKLIDAISKHFNSIVSFYKEHNEDLLSDVISTYNNNVVVQYCRITLPAKMIIFF